VRKANPQDFASWMSAIRKLKKEDHYISVMVAAAGVSTGSRTNNWKVVAQAVIIIGVPLLALSIASHFGLLMSRSDRRYDNTHTTDERFTSLLGYAVISFLAFGLLVSVYSHFDRKGRTNEIFGRIVTGVLRLFGAGKDV
jgi:magnesium-transporting ATPase (P-type)